MRAQSRASVTLKFRLEVTQGHWKLYHSIDRVYEFLLAFYSNYGAMYRLWDIARSKIAKFLYPMYLARLDLEEGVTPSEFREDV